MKLTVKTVMHTQVWCGDLCHRTRIVAMGSHADLGVNSMCDQRAR